MRIIKPMPDLVVKACEEVLNLYAYELKLTRGIEVNDLKDLDVFITAQSTEETDIMDCAVTLVLNVLDGVSETQFGTGLGGSFFQLDNGDRFSIMNYFDQNWRAGGGSSELPALVNMEEYLTFLHEQEIGFLNFLGLIKVALSDQVSLLDELDFIEPRYSDYVNAPCDLEGN